ncbi:amino acid ABC transporter substrate-binding pro tein [Desulfonema ishimotonii]|uniref:Amino acid ABC transporter substrate-binding pro tein n=2 Tax=Desulfonema ishimotonii TaxID=45657 RepID=A0A401FXH6_9BACT|nr:amino acid ABC transporter substrate-binding pro tein [Desulfonema ishimotonii]
MFVILGVSISLFMLPTMQSTAAPLQVVTFEQAPAEYEEQGVIKGIAVDIVKEVFARMHQPILLNLYPFANSINRIKKRKVDAIFAVTKKPERELFLNYTSEVLLDQTATLYVRKNSQIKFDGDFRKLSDYTFGVVNKATYGYKFDNAVTTGIISKIEGVSAYRLNVLKLVKNRLDIIVGPRLGILYEIKKLGQQEAVKELSPSIESVPTYIAFSKTRVMPDIIEQFDLILKEIKKDGTYEKIIQSYIK